MVTGDGSKLLLSLIIVQAGLERPEDVVIYLSMRKGEKRLFFVTGNLAYPNSVRIAFFKGAYV